MSENDIYIDLGSPEVMVIWLYHSYLIKTILMNLSNKSRGIFKAAANKREMTRWNK